MLKGSQSAMKMAQTELRDSGTSSSSKRRKLKKQSPELPQPVLQNVGPPPLESLDTYPSGLKETVL